MFAQPLSRLLFACSFVGAALLAQIQVAPAAKAPAEPSPPSVAESAAALRTPAEWPAALLRLVELARTRRQEVLQAIAPNLQPGGAAEVAARTRVLLDRLWLDANAAHKRDELRAHFRGVADAAADLERTLGGADEAQRKGLATLRQAIERMQQSLAKEAPLVAPPPLRVPAAQPAAAAPTAPGEGDGATPGYRAITVDGKTVLVPADALPEGAEYKAEFTEQGLVVRRKKAADPAPAKPAGGDPKGGTPPPAPKPEQPTGGQPGTGGSRQS